MMSSNMIMNGWLLATVGGSLVVGSDVYELSSVGWIMIMVVG